MDDAFTPEPDADDVCALSLVRRVAALLDQDATHWQEGMALPRGWEFILFGATTRQSELGRDGHHLPPPTLSDGAAAKVMLGGRRFRFHAPIPIGAAVRRSGEVVSVQHKEGRAGPMTIVTRMYRTLLTESGALAMEEEEDMVYRAADASISPAASTETTPAPRPAADIEQPYRTDETMLFRYSALGNNAHRIHYDLGFATRIEGYPALVVNGGLTNLKMVTFFREHVGSEPRTMTTRMLRPLFCGSANRLRLLREGDIHMVWAENDRGEQTSVALFT